MVTQGPGAAQPGDGQRTAAWTIASGLCLTQVGAGLPSPLYPLYQARWHLSPAAVTLLFVALIAGVLAALLLISPLADVVGRRAVLLAGCGLGMLACLAYALAGRPALILVGNLLQGAAIGTFSGPAAAALTELRLAGGARTVGRVITAANAVGLAAGPLWSGLLLQFAPWPGRLPYLVQAALLTPVAVVLSRLVEPATPRARRLRPLPRVDLPAADRPVFAAAVAAGFCAFALGGLFASVSPLVAEQLLSVRSGTLLGLIVSLLFTANASVQVVLRHLRIFTSFRLGLCLIAAGLLVVTLAPIAGGIATLLAGTIVTGAGQGATIAAGTAVVSALGEPHTRAATASAFFVVCYLGTALPALATGAVAAATTLYTSLIAFSATIGLSSLLLARCSGAWLGLRWSRQLGAGS